MRPNMSFEKNKVVGDLGFHLENSVGPDLPINCENGTSTHYNAVDNDSGAQLAVDGAARGADDSQTVSSRVR